MRVLHLLASGGTGGIETLIKDYGTCSRCENIFMFPWNGGALAESMKAEKLNVIELNASKKNLLKVLKTICQICYDENIDVVVEHHSSPILLAYLMLVKKRFRQISVVTYAHCNAESMRGGSGNHFLGLRRWLIKKAFQKADAVVAISHSVKDSLIRHYNLSTQEIEIIYNGVDVARMSSEQHQRHLTAEIVYVGRLIEEKGVQIVLKGLSLLPKHDAWNFSIVGDGPYRNKLEKMVYELGLCDKVTFCGTRNNIPEILKESDIFVHAPVCEEGFGITIVEAMAAGLLCACARSGAIPEIIQDGVNGFLFEKEDTKKLAETLDYCITAYDTDYMKTIRAAAVEKAKAFSMGGFADRLDGFLNEVGKK